MGGRDLGGGGAGGERSGGFSIGGLFALLEGAAQRGPIAVFALFVGALIGSPAVLEAFGAGSVTANGHADLHIICGSVIVVVVYVMHCICETTQCLIQARAHWHRTLPPRLSEGEGD